jgi:hypothetical protein
MRLELHWSEVEELTAEPGGVIPLAAPASATAGQSPVERLQAGR